MSPLKILVLALGLFLALWLVYKIGIVVLRVLAGLLFLSLIALAIWHFVLR